MWGVGGKVDAASRERGGERCVEPVSSTYYSIGRLASQIIDHRAVVRTQPSANAVR